MIHHHPTSNYGPADFGYEDRIGFSGAMLALIMVGLLLIVLALATVWSPWNSSGGSTPIQQNQPRQQQPALPPAASIEPDQPLLPREQLSDQNQPVPRTVPQSPR